MTEKVRIQGSKFAKLNGDKAHTEEKKYIYISMQICKTILYIFVMVTTYQRLITEVYNIKQEGPVGKPTKPNQKTKATTKTKTKQKHRNTRTRK